jgi:hypothetical protein
MFDICSGHLFIYMSLFAADPRDPRVKIAIINAACDESWQTLPLGGGVGGWGWGAGGRVAYWIQYACPTPVHSADHPTTESGGALRVPRSTKGVLDAHTGTRGTLGTRGAGRSPPSGASRQARRRRRTLRRSGLHYAEL